jgi:hypothetical protein
VERRVQAVSFERLHLLTVSSTSRCITSISSLVLDRRSIVTLGLPFWVSGMTHYQIFQRLVSNDCMWFERPSSLRVGIDRRGSSFGMDLIDACLKSSHAPFASYPRCSLVCANTLRQLVIICNMFKEYIALNCLANGGPRIPPEGVGHSPLSKLSAWLRLIILLESNPHAPLRSQPAFPPSGSINNKLDLTLYAATGHFTEDMAFRRSNRMSKSDRQEGASEKTPFVFPG